jgi:hypothetical protein
MMAVESMPDDRHAGVHGQLHRLVNSLPTSGYCRRAPIRFGRGRLPLSLAQALERHHPSPLHSHSPLLC